MKAKLLNPLQEMMGRLVSRTCDMLAKNVKGESYTALREWLCSAVIMYALTVDSGNDMYLKTVKSVFDDHIKAQSDVPCESISMILGDMISLLTGK